MSLASGLSYDLEIGHVQHTLTQINTVLIRPVHVHSIEDMQNKLHISKIVPNLIRILLGNAKILLGSAKSLSLLFSHS